MKNLVLISTLFLSTFGNTQQLNGVVLDAETATGIPFANIYCLETQNGATADSNGNSQISNVVNN